MKVLLFMKGRAEVYVSDIIEHSGAEALRVYPIILEELQKGRVKVIKEDSLGAPVIVTMIEQ